MKIIGGIKKPVPKIIQYKPQLSPKKQAPHQGRWYCLLFCFKSGKGGCSVEFEIMLG